VGGSRFGILEGTKMKYEFTINEDAYSLDTENLLMSECIAIEKVTGLTWSEWESAVSSGSMSALKAGLWVAVKRKQPELRFSDFDFSWGDFDVVDQEAEPAPKEEADNT
jgi:hypothetical protein